MYTLLLLIFVLLHHEAGCQAPDVREFCTRVLENPFNPCDVDQCRGRDGKRGPRGVKGEKGDEGPGTEALRAELAATKEKLKENEKSSVLNFCGMGMKSGVIADGDLTASSSASGTRGKRWARLDQRSVRGTSSGAWCPEGNDRRSWIQVDFKAPKEISGILTQGSPSEDHWTTTFIVSCRGVNGGFVDVTEYGSVKIFRGNSDRNTKSVNFLAEKIKCRSIRIQPRSWNGRACMRFEILRGICHSPEYYSFYLESAGYVDGNFCKVFINGVDRATRGFPRAHCVVIFNPKTKAITAQRFDTYGSVNNTNAMVSFIESASDYSVIAITIMDATKPDHITDQASALLKKLGAVGNSCPTKPAVRDAWAFITQKVGSGDIRPPWVQCQHVPVHNGKATLHATITTSAYYASWDESPIA